MIYSEIVGLCWIVFVVYWLISALQAKRHVSRGPGAFWRIIGLFLVIIVLNVSFFRTLNAQLSGSFSFPLMEPLGVLFVVFGIGLAVWARVHLGRNWGMPMSVQENAELAMTGPYAYIRNPIYSGVLLAMLGSMLVIGLSWFIPFIFFAIFFIYSAKAEEKLMLAQFPNTYPAYKKRTKMLIPFVL